MHCAVDWFCSRMGFVKLLKNCAISLTEYDVEARKANAEVEAEIGRKVLQQKIQEEVLQEEEQQHEEKCWNCDGEFTLLQTTSAICDLFRTM